MGDAAALVCRGQVEHPHLERGHGFVLNDVVRTFERVKWTWSGRADIRWALYGRGKDVETLSGFRFSVFGFRVSDFGFQVSGFGVRFSVFGFRF